MSLTAICANRSYHPYVVFLLCGTLSFSYYKYNQLKSPYKECTVKTVHN